MLSMHMFVLPELVYCASSPKWLTKVIMRQNKMWYTGPMAIIWHTFNAWLCISLNYPCLLVHQWPFMIWSSLISRNIRIRSAVILHKIDEPSRIAQRFLIWSGVLPSRKIKREMQGGSHTFDPSYNSCGEIWLIYSCLLQKQTLKQIAVWNSIHSQQDIYQTAIHYTDRYRRQKDKQ